MAYYDHFHSSDTGSITLIGRKLVGIQNQFFVDLVKRYCLSRSPSVLEIGCGRGFFAEQCRLNDLSYTAVEANEKMAADLSGRGFTVHQAFVPPLKLGKKYDAIVMDQVFEHMRNRDDALALIASCKAHLSDNGILLISSPDIFTAKEDFFQDYTHNYPTCMPMLVQILTDSELGIVYRNHISFFIRGLLSTRLLAFFVRLCYSLGLFHVAFGKRAYQAKLSLLPSCVIIGRANEGPS